MDIRTLAGEPHTTPRRLRLQTGESQARYVVGDHSIPVGTALSFRLGPFPSWCWDSSKESIGSKGICSRTIFMGNSLEVVGRVLGLDGDTGIDCQGSGAEAVGREFEASLGSTVRAYLKTKRTSK